MERRRYIVYHNPDEAVQDVADREAILLALEDQLRQGAKRLVGNRGYQRFLRIDPESITIDRAKVEAEARYDGKFVLRTNTTLPATEVATQYKRLLLVEQFFRAPKSLMEPASLPSPGAPGPGGLDRVPGARQLRYPQVPALSPALHAHGGLLAQPSGAVVCYAGPEADPSRLVHERARPRPQDHALPRALQSPPEALRLDEIRRRDL